MFMVTNLYIHSKLSDKHSVVKLSCGLLCVPCWVHPRTSVRLCWAGQIPRPVYQVRSNRVIWTAIPQAFWGLPWPLSIWCWPPVSYFHNRQWHILLHMLRSTVLWCMAWALQGPGEHGRTPGYQALRRYCISKKLHMCVFNIHNTHWKIELDYCPYFWSQVTKFFCMLANMFTCIKCQRTILMLRIALSVSYPVSCFELLSISILISYKFYWVHCAHGIVPAYFIAGIVSSLLFVQSFNTIMER